MSATHLPRSAELPPPTTQEISDGIYAYVQLDGSWGLNNAGFIVGRDAVTIIDTCFTEARTRSFLQSLGSITSLPARALINTHHHGDHTHGNYLVPGATIIAHRLLLKIICKKLVVLVVTKMSAHVQDIAKLPRHYSIIRMI